MHTVIPLATGTCTSHGSTALSSRIFLLPIACLYVERNGRFAGLVKRAENRRFGSLWRRLQRPEPELPLLSLWLIGRSADWISQVNEALGEKKQTMTLVPILFGTGFAHSVSIVFGTHFAPGQPHADGPPC